MGVNTLIVAVAVGVTGVSVGCSVGFTTTAVESTCVEVLVSSGWVGVCWRVHAASNSPNKTKSPQPPVNEMILFMLEFYNKKGFTVWQTPYLLQVIDLGEFLR